METKEEKLGNKQAHSKNHCNAFSVSHLAVVIRNMPQTIQATDSAWSPALARGVTQTTAETLRRALKPVTGQGNRPDLARIHLHRKTLSLY